jgi:hypothetical protein
MLPPSSNPLELELLIGVAGVLIFVASFLALLCSAVFGLGLAQLLYFGGQWCVTKFHQSYSLNSLSGTRTIHAIARIAPHHSH